MKNVATTVLRTITVESNGAGNSKDKWMRIRDAKTREILHTGQPTYIRGIAKRKYNHKVA